MGKEVVRKNRRFLRPGGSHAGGKGSQDNAGQKVLGEVKLEPTGWFGFDFGTLVRRTAGC